MVNIAINKNDKDLVDVEIGDLFYFKDFNKEWGICMIVHDGAISLGKLGAIWKWKDYLDTIKKFIHAGDIELAPKGTQVIITQE